MTNLTANKSHAVVGGSTTTFRRHPVDVLGDVLDVACLAVQTVLCVDLESTAFAGFKRNILIDAGRAEVLLRPAERGEVALDGNLVVA